MTADSGIDVRPLVAADADANRTLGWEAFGLPATPPTDAATIDQPGRQWWGAFAGDRLAARLCVRTYDSWFGGARVPTAGVAGVTVGMEYRGRGLLSPLLGAALGRARELGSAISTLFPTAP